MLMKSHSLAMWPKISCLSSLASVSSSIKKDSDAPHHRVIVRFKQETPCREFSRETRRRQVTVIHTLAFTGFIVAIALFLW